MSRSSWRSTVTQAVVTCRSFALVKQREHCGLSTRRAAGLHAAELFGPKLSGFLHGQLSLRSPDNGVTPPASADSSSAGVHAESRRARTVLNEMS